MPGEMMMSDWGRFTIQNDDSHEIEIPEPILTIERHGVELGEVVIHRSESELEELAETDGLARLALEIVRLRNRLRH
jgi:hypothetical protein